MLYQTVDYLPLDTLFSALQINRATGYRYLNRISETLASCNVWSYESGDGSLDNEGIQIFEIFTQLALEHSPKFAAKNLIKELEKHGYIIEQNQQNNRTNYRTSKQSNDSGTATDERKNQQSKSANFYDSLLGI